MRLLSLDPHSRVARPASLARRRRDLHQRFARAALPSVGCRREAARDRFHFDRDRMSYMAARTYLRKMALYIYYVVL